MKRPLVVFRPFAMVAVLCGVSLLPFLQAQQGAPPKAPLYSYSSGEAKDLRIAQLEFQAAQRDLNTALRDWSEACESLRQAKKWPEGTTCNIQTGEIIPPPLPAPKSGEKK